MQERTTVVCSLRRERLLSVSLRRRNTVYSSLSPASLGPTSCLRRCRTRGPWPPRSPPTPLGGVVGPNELPEIRERDKDLY